MCRETQKTSQMHTVILIPGTFGEITGEQIRTKQGEDPSLEKFFNALDCSEDECHRPDRWRVLPPTLRAGVMCSYLEGRGHVDYLKTLSSIIENFFSNGYQRPYTRLYGVPEAEGRQTLIRLIGSLKRCRLKERGM